MAICRRVELSKEEFSIYAAELQMFEPEDIKAALRELGRRERQQYETAWPELGKLLNACRAATSRRIESLCPPRPKPPEQGPVFEPCAGPHIGHSYTAYLDGDGNPTTHDRSPQRIIGQCKCVREHQQRIFEWNRPYMQAYRDWEEQCTLIRQEHRALLEAA